MRIILFVIISFLNFQLLHAKEKKVFYLFGGGGESLSSDRTIFDNDLINLSSLSESAKYNTSVVFDGGHKITERLISVGFPSAPSKKDFTEKNYDQALKDLKQKIKSMGKNDQLLISIATHGAMKNKNDLTHRIALAKKEAKDLVNLKNADKVSVDKIITVAKLAAAKGIKVAIVDLSCYSGNLLNANDSNLCLISAAGKETPAWVSYDNKVKDFTDFGHHFTKNLTKGENLEDIFLKAIKDSKTVELPMISTPEGRALYEMFTSILEPFIQSDTSLLYQVKDLNQTLYSQCTYPQLLEKFQKKIDTLKKHTLYPIFKSQLGSIESAAKDYYQTFQSFASHMKTAHQLSGDYQNALAYLNQNYPNFKRKDEEYFSIDEFLKANYKSSEGFGLPIGVNSKNPNEVEAYLREIEVEKKIQEDILSKFPQIKERIKATELDSKKQNETLEKKAAIITTKMREVYLKLYSEMKQKTSNPCRNFKI